MRAGSAWGAADDLRQALQGATTVEGRTVRLRAWTALRRNGSPQGVIISTLAATIMRTKYDGDLAEAQDEAAGILSGRP